MGLWKSASETFATMHDLYQTPVHEPFYVQDRFGDDMSIGVYTVRDGHRYFIPIHGGFRGAVPRFPELYPN